MELSNEVTRLMGQKVTYCRAKAAENGQPELMHGTGIIVGVIVGASRRVQIMVKDHEVDKNQAWTLDLMCVNPTDADATAYFDHHKKLRTLVEQHNAITRQRQQAGIKSRDYDGLNYAMFGQPLEI